MQVRACAAPRTTREPDLLRLRYLLSDHHINPVEVGIPGQIAVLMANATDWWGAGWGYYVLIDHGNGYQTRYAHCSAVNVTVGQKVAQGQLIGLVGNTGDSYGAHCHFEILVNGVSQNPLNFVQ